MILRHRRRKGFLGREKKVEKDYLYEHHAGVAPLADHVSGEKHGVGSTHTRREVYTTLTLWNPTTTPCMRSEKK